MTDKGNYIGKQLTWSQAIELFPDLWVSFRDCEFKGATFIKGILVDVISDNDRIKYMEDHWGEKRTARTIYRCQPLMTFYCRMWRLTAGE